MWFLNIRRVLVAQHRIDFRKHFNGLLAEAYKVGADPYKGDCLIFYSRDNSQLRAVAGDELGLVLVYRRFEGGGMRRGFAFANNPAAKTISQSELAMLFAGNTYEICRRANPWKK